MFNPRNAPLPDKYKEIVDATKEKIAEIADEEIKKTQWHQDASSQKLLEAHEATVNIFKEIYSVQKAYDELRGRLAHHGASMSANSIGQIFKSIAKHRANIENYSSQMKIPEGK